MKDKLVLGTANFGLNYGIANGRQLDRSRIHRILTTAQAGGIWGIDTAQAYGDAEARIGGFLKRNGKVFKVISKLREQDYSTPEAVEEAIAISLHRLQIPSIDILLMHSFQDYRKYRDRILPVLQGYKRKKVIGQYGVSVYHPEEMKQIADEAHEEMAFAFPVNLFDQRFLAGALLERLKKDGFTLFGRSAFLQGLFFLDDAKLVGPFLKVKEKLARLREISEAAALPFESLPLLFGLSNRFLDGIIIGVDTLAHFNRNIACLSERYRAAYRRIGPLWKTFAIDDERILLPYHWAH
ncbi:MAG: aldo/keto reductase [Nitrospiria bacterium]